MSSVKDRYKAALIEEHDSYVRSGRTKDAEGVARVLKEQYDHEVSKQDEGEERPKLASTLPESVDEQKPPENTAESKPRRGARTKLGQDDAK